MNPQRSTFDSLPSICLHIEELVLHGFAPGDRDGIAAAVEQELARLFSEQALPPVLKKNISLDRVDGGSFRMAIPVKPTTVGTQIAEAIHGGIRL